MAKQLPVYKAISYQNYMLVFLTSSKLLLKVNSKQNLTDLDTADFSVSRPLGVAVQRLFFPAPPAAFSALHLLMPQQCWSPMMTPGCTVVVVPLLDEQLPHLTRPAVQLTHSCCYN